MMKLVLSVVTCIILQQVCAEEYTGSAWPVPLLGSCKEIHTKYPAAVSGDYNIQVKSGANVRVYCEMAINGGGYTFLHPASFYQIVPSDVTAMVTDTASALLSVRIANGFVKYAVLSQLDQYSSQPISITLNGDPAYRKPQNSGQGDRIGLVTPPGGNFIGTPFLEVSFLPIANASNNAQQGVKFNGVPVPFINCDSNPNSYFAVFPNLAEKPVTGRGNAGGPIVAAIFDKTNIPGSYKHIPIDYFMQFELMFGGCGGYYELYPNEPTYRGFQLGFR